jgi:chitosanase
MIAAFALACGGASTEQASGGESDINKGAASSRQGMDALAKHKAEMLTSIWENGTTVLQYAYCENIGDGRGYTSGRAGFCTGTGDAVLVVKCAGGSSRLERYVPALEKLDRVAQASGQDQASTTTLDALGDYCADWAASAADAAFRACEDRVVTELYFQPALAQAEKQGLSTALAKAALYDAEINHGDDGVSELVAKATAEVGAVSGPRTTDEESAWLRAFLARRVAVMAADAAWAQAVDRVALYEQLRRDRNFALGQRIETTAKAMTLYPGQSLRDSGYPDCVIDPAGVVSGAATCTQP